MKKAIDAIAPKTVDEYLAMQPGPVREMLEQLRQTILKAAPGAEELISYGMPGYKLNGPLVYFGAFKKHCSFFPGSGSLLNEFAEELKEFTTSKGTLQFTVDKPLPKALATRMVKLRVKQNLSKGK